MIAHLEVKFVVIMVTVQNDVRFENIAQLMKKKMVLQVSDVIDLHYFVLNQNITYQLPETNFIFILFHSKNLQAAKIRSLIVRPHVQIVVRHKPSKIVKNTAGYVKVLVV